jgi:phospholipid transport system substrate-binding protein
VRGVAPNERHAAATMRTMRNLGVALACALGAGVAAAQLLPPPQQRPDVLMSTVTSEVIAVVRQDAAAGRPTGVAQLVESRVLPLFDFHRMTALAMGRNWPDASPEQQAALVAQFRTLLVRTYSAALSGYRGQEVEYRPLRAAAGDSEVQVRSFISRSGAEALTIDYDMENGLAGWKVFDVKIAGVSLVMSYRESFAAEVRSSSIEGLIRALSDRNRRNAPDANAVETGKRPE